MKRTLETGVYKSVDLTSEAIDLDDAKEPAMSSMYAMRRANGDWFAFEEKGNLRVPVFRSSHKAMQARARNWGMLLFRPVVFDEQALKELAPTGGEGGACFWMANGSSTNLRHGRLIDHARLALLMQGTTEQRPE